MRKIVSSCRLRCCFLFVFCGLCCSFLNGQSFEFRLLLKINHTGNKNFTNVMHGFSLSMIPISLATPASVFYDERNEKLKPGTFNAVSALIATGVITQVLKSTIKRPRPFETHTNILKYENVGGYSFPSGHTSLSFCAATTMALHYKKMEVAIPAFAWAATVAYSRMHLGVHYPTDVLAGMAIGILAPVAVWKISEKVRRK